MAVPSRRTALRTALSAFALTAGLAVLPAAAQTDPSAPPPAPVGGYYTADGQRTADYAAALASWRSDKQFGVDYAKGFLGLEYAYVLGLSGKGQTIGMNDIGVLFEHPLFAGDGKITGLHTNVSADYGNDGRINPRRPWGTHGTHTAGSAAGNRLAQGTMFGAAYDANIIAATTNFAEGDFLWWRDALYTDKSPETSIQNIIDLANTGKARIISNSWGSGNFLPYDASRADVRYWYEQDLGGLFDPVLKNDALVVFAAGNGFGDHASAQALVPLSDPRLRSNWLSVANYKADGTAHWSTSLCGQTATWCVAGPGVKIISGMTYFAMDNDAVAAKYSDALYAPIFNATDFDQLVNAAFRAWDTTVVDYVHRRDAAKKAGLAFDEDAARTEVAHKAVGITLAFGAAVGGDPDALVDTMAFIISWPGFIKEARGLPDEWSIDVLGKAGAFIAEDTKQFVHVSDPTYGPLTGTSMATPAVAGFAAVLMQAFPNYNTGLISDILLSSSKDLDEPGVDLRSGWGVPQMGTALRGPTALRQTRQVDVPEGRTDVWSNGIQDARDRYTPEVLEGYPDDIGGIVKRGGGQLILSGSNSYSGDTRVEEGLLTVDGSLTRSALTAIGGGIVGGTGTLAALTAADGGVVSPGDAGRIGTLTVAGPATLAAGSRYIVDIGASGVSDRLVADQATLGGGTITLRPNGHVPHYGDHYDVLSAGGGISGRFGTATPLSAILYPELGYGSTLVTARIAALPYAIVVAATPVQTAYARLLDGNRSAYDRLAGIYAPLDLQSAPVIQGTLESLAPRAESTRRAIGTGAGEALGRFYRDRLRTLAADRFEGGSIAMIGKPVEFAANAIALPGRALTVSDTPATTTIQAGALPDNVSVYLAGGYVDGSGAAAPGTAFAARRDRFDGFYVAGGLETKLSDHAALGFGLSYAQIDGKPQAGQSAKGELIQGTLYGRLGDTLGASLDTQVSAGVYQSTTRRGGDFLGLTYALRGRDDALALSTEIGGSYGFGNDTLHIAPRVSLRASRIDFTPTAETGTGPALVTARDRYGSLQSRAGIQVEGDADALRPFASVAYVHDFLAHPDQVQVGFADGTPLRVPFATLTRDRNWGELSSGIAYHSGNTTVSFATDGTIGRHDVHSRTYRAGLTLAF